MSVGSAIKLTNMKIEQIKQTLPPYCGCKHTPLERTTVRWIHSWVQDHAQKMLINSSFTNSEKVTSGVIQGAVLATFIKDLDEEVHRVLTKFAQDTKLGGKAKTLEDRNKFKKILINSSTGLKTT